MSSPSAGACLFLAVILIGAPEGASAQGWSVDLSAGRTVYDPLSVNVGTNNLAGSIRYDTRRDGWVYGAAAAPLGDQAPFWGASGAGGRFMLPGSETRRATVGVELGAHGFLFRDAVVEQTGNGGTLDAIPFARLSAGAAHVELRGGWRGHALSFGGETQRRGVLETGGRFTYDAPLRLEADARWVRTSEGTYPFMGASVLYGGAAAYVWGQAGKWVSDELDDEAWGVGLGLALGGRATLWATLRQEAPDPLYWNAARRSWSVGVTRRLGRAPATLLPAPRSEDGGVIIRLPVSDAPAGQLSIAGSFNGWTPVPMQREGGEWLIRLPLAAGVYQFAFRSTDGDWFVPASVAGRRDDGMGGHVAVLVVL